jgi:hypothetical protein
MVYYIAGKVDQIPCRGLNSLQIDIISCAAIDTPIAQIKHSDPGSAIR